MGKIVEAFNEISEGKPPSEVVNIAVSQMI